MAHLGVFHIPSVHVQVKPLALRAVSPGSIQPLEHVLGKVLHIANPETAARELLLSLNPAVTCGVHPAAQGFLLSLNPGLMCGIHSSAQGVLVHPLMSQNYCGESQLSVLR